MTSRTVALTMLVPCMLEMLRRLGYANQRAVFDPGRWVSRAAGVEAILS